MALQPREKPFKICYDPAAPAVITGIDRDPVNGEEMIETRCFWPHGFEFEFYIIEDGAVVPKAGGEVAAIRFQRQLQERGQTVQSALHAYLDAKIEPRAQQYLQKLYQRKARLPSGVVTKLEEVDDWIDSVMQYFRDMVDELEAGRLPECDFSQFDATMPTMPDGSPITAKRIIDAVFPKA